jgi:hypothetical protein
LFAATRCLRGARWVCRQVSIAMEQAGFSFLLSKQSTAKFFIPAVGARAANPGGQGGPPWPNVPIGALPTFHCVCAMRFDEEAPHRRPPALADPSDDPPPPGGRVPAPVRLLSLRDDDPGHPTVQPDRARAFALRRHALRLTPCASSLCVLVEAAFTQLSPHTACARSSAQPPAPDRACECGLARAWAGPGCARSRARPPAGPGMLYRVHIVVPKSRVHACACYSKTWSASMFLKARGG